MRVLTLHRQIARGYEQSLRRCLAGKPVSCLTVRNRLLSGCPTKNPNTKTARTFMKTKARVLLRGRRKVITHRPSCGLPLARECAAGSRVYYLGQAFNRLEVLSNGH